MKSICTTFRFFISLIILGVAFTLTASSQSMNTRELNASWQFRKIGDKKWLPATVPGTVHTDLLNNKIIDDPFYGDNEKKQQWIDTCAWEYETYFDCDSALLNQGHIELQFDGLDTYAKVYLNNELLIEADNMFRTWNVKCKSYLKGEGNHLLIQFEPAVLKGKALAKNLPYTLPGEERVFTRKAAYQYGWDFGPRFVTCGIWRPVKIVTWSLFKVNDIRVIQDQLSDANADLVAEINITTDAATTVYFKMVLGTTIPDSLYYEQPVQIGENTLNLPFKIKNPKRWWCNGMGDPNMYHATLQISNALSQSEMRNISMGLRTIQLVQQDDSLGQRFYFKLNGVPVFMKGANYVPADNFLPRVTDQRYREIIQSAVDANMNMLRVWGGGVYEDDKFYNICDEKGILVWQDFMFAGSMYPGDADFIENVKQEVTQNVTRLRNHPSLALWCGNNEIDEGWQNWGWQQQYKYSAKDSAKIRGDYEKLFRETISQIVDRVDPLHSYWPSSPQIGWGHEESLWEGDSHYWGVWWGNEPFDAYKEKVGRFASEYGFQGMPSLNTIKKYCDEKDLSLQSSCVKTHQKNAKGFETIQSYLDKEYKQPKDFENYIYVSQLLQAKGIKTAIEAHRRGRPHCMGSLYWQLNDCWPGTTWSSTDYNGDWKAVHYVAKNAFEKILVSPLIEEHILKVYVMNDTKTKMNVTLEMKMMDFSGTVAWTKNVPLIILSDSARVYFNIDSAEVLKNIDPSKTVLSVRLTRDQQVISENTLFFIPDKDLKLAQPLITYTFGTAGKKSTLELEAKSVAKNVCIDFQESKVKLSDNYFDLLPGQKKTILIDGNVNSADLAKKIKVKSLIDSY